MAFQTKNFLSEVFLLHVSGVAVAVAAVAFTVVLELWLASSMVEVQAINQKG